MDILLNILTFGLKPLYEKHMEFHNIINDFRNKLPRPQNQAKNLTEKEKDKIWWLKETSLKYFNVINLNTQKISLSESDIDEFYNRLDNVDLILFKGYYFRYIRNLKRFNPKAENKNFEIAVLQKALEKNKLNPTKPIPILLHHIKYEYKLTSIPYIWYRKKKRYKKLNTHNSRHGAGS